MLIYLLRLRSLDNLDQCFIYSADLDWDDSTKVPCILHMDSIKGSHAGLKNLVQRYVSSLTVMLGFVF